MISNILILIILICLAIRLLTLIILILRRLNRSRSLTPIKSLGSLTAILFPPAQLQPHQDVSTFAKF